MATPAPATEVVTVDLSDLDLEDGVRHKLENGKELNIIIIGRFQVGKSTLVKNMFKNSVEVPISSDKKPCTKSVQVYCFKPEGTDAIVRIYDSRGLQDGEGEDKSYLREIKRACLNIHLVIYCTKLADPIRPDERVALKNIARELGKNLQGNIVIALTFANRVDPESDDVNEVEYFKNEVETKQEVLDECFKELKIEKYFANYRDRTYAVGSSKRPQLPTGDEWLAKFWAGCLQACETEAKCVVFKIAWRQKAFIALMVTERSLNYGAMQMIEGNIDAGWRVITAIKKRVSEAIDMKRLYDLDYKQIKLRITFS